MHGDCELPDRESRYLTLEPRRFCRTIRRRGPTPLKTRASQFFRGKPTRERRNPHIGQTHQGTSAKAFPRTTPIHSEVVCVKCLGSRRPSGCWGGGLPTPRNPGPPRLGASEDLRPSHPLRTAEVIFSGNQFSPKRLTEKALNCAKPVPRTKPTPISLVPPLAMPSWTLPRPYSSGSIGRRTLRSGSVRSEKTFPRTKPILSEVVSPKDVNAPETGFPERAKRGPSSAEGAKKRGPFGCRAGPAERPACASISGSRSPRRWESGRAVCSPRFRPGCRGNAAWPPSPAWPSCRRTPGAARGGPPRKAGSQIFRRPSG